MTCPTAAASQSQRTAAMAAIVGQVFRRFAQYAWTTVFVRLFDFCLEQIQESLSIHCTWATTWLFMFSDMMRRISFIVLNT